MAVLLALAAVAVGHAIHLRDGEYSYPGMSLVIAIHWVGARLILTTAAVAFSSVRVSRERWLLAALAGGVAFQFYQLLRSPPGGWNPWSNDLQISSPNELRPFYAGVAAAAVLSAGLLLRSPIVRQVCLPLILLAHLLLGAWMLRASPDPLIDVFVFQQQAPAALLEGKNPYAMTFVDVYGSDAAGARAVYGQGLTRDGKVTFGFPYLPVSLFISLVAYGAAGDYRYAQLVAMTAAGALLAYARPGRVAALAAVLLLFTPRAFFVLGRGWSEPYVVVLLAAVVFCACRGLALLPVALGLFLASKQYLVLALPACLILAASLGDRRQAIGLAWKAALVAIVVTLPLALWDWDAFWFSTVTVQKEAPFRDDALSYLVYWKQAFGGATPLFGRPVEQHGATLAFVATIPAVLLALFRAPRTPAGFAAALALSFLPFIALNKQAFANYYYFTIGCLCSAIAASRPGEDEDLPPPPVEEGDSPA